MSDLVEDLGPKAIITQALEWYIDDRHECAKHNKAESELHKEAAEQASEVWDDLKNGDLMVTSENRPLTSPDGRHTRGVGLSFGEVIRIEDGPRHINISLDNNENLRVEMVDEEKNLIETEENNQPNIYNVNAILKPSS